MTGATNVKFVDDITLVTIDMGKLMSDSMKTATDQRVNRSRENKLDINVTNTTECLMILVQNNGLPLIKVNGEFIERVDPSKHVGIVIRSDLKWHLQCLLYEFKCSRIYYLVKLKISGLCQFDLLPIYVSLIRIAVRHLVHRIVQRVVSDNGVYPERSFQESVVQGVIPDTCPILRLPTLTERHDLMCKRLFNVMFDPHRRHHILPVKRHLVNYIIP